MEVKSLPALNTVLTQDFDPAGRVIRRTDGEVSYQQTHLGYRLLSRDDAAGNPTLQFTGGVGVDEVALQISLGSEADAVHQTVKSAVIFLQLAE